MEETPPSSFLLKNIFHLPIDKLLTGGVLLFLVDRYESQRKSGRNQALCKYRLEHPEMTLAEIGREFNISRQLVWKLTQGNSRKKEKAAV